MTKQDIDDLHMIRGWLAAIIGGWDPRQMFLFREADMVRWIDRILKAEKKRRREWDIANKSSQMKLND